MFASQIHSLHTIKLIFVPHTIYSKTLTFRIIQNGHFQYRVITCIILMIVINWKWGNRSYVNEVMYYDNHTGCVYPLVPISIWLLYPVFQILNNSKCVTKHKLALMQKWPIQSILPNQLLFGCFRILSITDVSQESDNVW